MIKPNCKYKCQKCYCEFEREKPGPVVCENCGHNYVDWLNSVEVLAYIYNHSAAFEERKYPDNKQEEMEILRGEDKCLKKRSGKIIM